MMKRQVKCGISKTLNEMLFDKKHGFKIIIPHLDVDIGAQN